MNLSRRLKTLLVGVSLTASGAVFAQFNAPTPDAMPFPMEFETSRDHYDYLLDYYKGGVQHDYMSVPKWEGLWSTGGNTGRNRPFMADREIIEGVLTPEYEAAFRYRRELGDESNSRGVDYDRLTTCEPAGMPRWLLEPYVREFLMAICERAATGLPEAGLLITALNVVSSGQPAIAR